MRHSFPRQLRRSACADKNDRLGWTCGQSFRVARDRTFGLRTNREDLLPLLSSLLPAMGPPLAETDTEVDTLLSVRFGGDSTRKGVRHYHLLYEDFTRLERTLEQDDLLDGFVRQAAAVACDLQYHQSLVIHLGVSVREADEGFVFIDSRKRLPALSRWAATDTWHLLSGSVAVFNNQGHLRPAPMAADGAGLLEQHPDKDKVISLKNLVFFEDTPEAYSISAGQAVLRLLPGVGGNPVMAGRLFALSNALRACKIMVYPRQLFDREPENLRKQLRSEAHCAEA